MVLRALSKMTLGAANCVRSIWVMAAKTSWATMLESGKVLMQETSNCSRLSGSSGMISTVRSSTMREKFLVAWQRLLRACSKVWPVRSAVKGTSRKLESKTMLMPAALPRVRKIERRLDSSGTLIWRGSSLAFSLIGNSILAGCSGTAAAGRRQLPGLQCDLRVAGVVGQGLARTPPPPPPCVRFAASLRAACRWTRLAERRARSTAIR